MNTANLNAKDLKIKIKSLQADLSKAINQLVKLEGKSLTDVAVKGMKAGQLLTDAGDNLGLRVRCSTKGVKVFFYRYRSPDTGKLKQYKIGAYPNTSLAEARHKLSILKAKRKDGICPVSERENERNEQKRQEQAEQLEKQVLKVTIQNIIDTFLREYIDDKKENIVYDNTNKVISFDTIKGNRKEKGQKECRRLLYRGVVDLIGQESAIKITHNDIHELITNVVKTGHLVKAGNILSELSLAFDYCIGVTKLLPDGYVNPCIQVKQNLKLAKIRVTPKQGKRFLTDGELSSFQHWLPESRYTKPVKNIFMLTLYTGCRTGEIVEAEWKDIDLKAGTLFLSQTKTSSSRTVQLSTQAISILETIPQKSNYVFPSDKDNNKPILQRRLSWEGCNIRKSSEKSPLLTLDIPHWTPHDLRRTVRTGLSRIRRNKKERCPEAVAEAILGHSKKGIEGTYNLHKYDDECREWLQTWCNHLDTLAGVKNVVLLRTAL